ncbi:hypothetical protein BCR34DRAFT_664623 [Clohesyomyces aquaticus]|uniref:N-acetylgalactosaminide beta-1,3-galactosyltransferase n=1 Tax=Clohesyomyces aquaticus TaxID=1231657 RepID=A0A1Y1ZMK1_9PLEO|nr:hypothetical protein BCR34DRAFT_664623 [Clohesyomyces aquaticus]
MESMAWYNEKCSLAVPQELAWDSHIRNRLQGFRSALNMKAEFNDLTKRIEMFERSAVAVKRRGVFSKLCPRKVSHEALTTYGMLVQFKRLNAQPPQYFLRSLSSPRRRNRAILLVITTCLCFYYFRFLYYGSFSTSPYTGDSEPYCPDSPISQDILLILRTDTTKAQEKVPVHFKTTLRCIPNYVNFSDYEERIKGHYAVDVLSEVNEDLKRVAPEFGLYNHLRERGREGLDWNEHLGSGPSGSLSNPGWKLDRFKFIPMVDKAFRHHPKAKWFVFTEPDTYMVWPNVLKYLSQFDENQPRYLGKHMFIGDVLFAHGGSGFALSNAAAERVTKHWNANIDEYDRYTVKQWAGDMVLGKVLRDVGINLFWSFLHFQGDPVCSLDFNITKNDKRPWCYAPITFHHMRQEEIRSLWQFEQAWYRTRDVADPIRYRDVFKGYVMPWFRKERTDWDNLSMEKEYSDEALRKLSEDGRKAISREERDASVSWKNCRAACESISSCLQYSYSPGKCSVSSEVRKGYEASSQCVEYSYAASKCIRTQAAAAEDQKKPMVRSGWMMEIISEFVKEMDLSCQTNQGNDWIV